MNMKEFTRKYGVHFSTHGGKLEGIQSLNTSVALNPICKARAQVPDSICAHCYARNYVSFRKGLRDNLADNTQVLTTQVIPVEEWPVINASVFRLESFGDLNNSIQVKNYFNFARRNPRTTFALWTKNPQIIHAAMMDGYTKPRNLIIIQSSVHVNKEDAPRYEFIDKIFTVYAPDYIKDHDVTINCGARDCLGCGRCYKHTRKVEHIQEKLK